MTTVLVAHASKHGATAGIASAVAHALDALGLDATCMEAGAVESLDGYDAVVLGSAVYLKRWRPEARRFLRRYRDALAERPFWVFSSGPVGDPTKDNPAWLEPGRIIAKAVELGARDHKVFGGVAHGAMAKDLPEEWRDRRDWDEIRAWADGIAAALETASKVSA
jgi:menaquinone-dependent protoporphyrinogen oxidase